MKKINVFVKEITALFIVTILFTTISPAVGKPSNDDQSGMQEVIEMILKQASALEAKGQKLAAKTKKAMANLYIAQYESEQSGNKELAEEKIMIAMIALHTAQADEDLANGNSEGAAKQRAAATSLQHRITAMHKPVTKGGLKQYEVDVLYAQATKLEDQGRWRDAESIWRKLDGAPDIDDRLVANLRKQGKKNQATIVEEKMFASKLAQAAGREPDPRAAQNEQLNQLYKDLEATTDYKQNAQLIRDANEFRQLMSDPSPAARKRLLQLQQKTFAKELAERKNNPDNQKDDEDAQNGVKMMKIFSENQAMIEKMTDGFEWAGTKGMQYEKHGRPFERAELALKQIDASRFVEAEKNLVIACPKIDFNVIVDLPTPTIALPKVGDEGPDPTPSTFTSAKCFSELALVRAALRPKNNIDFDEAAFLAAQRAVLTNARKALSQATARKFVEKHGGGPILAEIDKNGKIVMNHSQKFFAQWSGVDINEKLSESPAQLPDFFDKLIKLNKLTEPNSNAIEKLVIDLKKKCRNILSFARPNLSNCEPCKCATGLMHRY